MDQDQKECLSVEESSRLLLGYAEADRFRVAQHDTAEAWLAVMHIINVVKSHPVSLCVNEEGCLALAKLSSILSDRLKAEPPPPTGADHSEDWRIAVYARRHKIAPGAVQMCLAAAERFPLAEGLQVAALRGLSAFLEALETCQRSVNFDAAILSVVGEVPDAVSPGVAAVLASARRFPRNVSLQQSAWSIITVSCFSGLSNTVPGDMGVAKHRAVFEALAALLCDLLGPLQAPATAGGTSSADLPPSSAAAAALPGDWAETTRPILHTLLGAILQCDATQAMLSPGLQESAAGSNDGIVFFLAQCLKHEAEWLATATKSVIAATGRSPTHVVGGCCKALCSLLTVRSSKRGGSCSRSLSPQTRAFVAAGGVQGAVACIYALVTLASRFAVPEDELEGAVECVCSVLDAFGEGEAVLTAMTPLFAPTHRVAWLPLIGLLNTVLIDSIDDRNASGRLAELAVSAGAMDAACTVRLCDVRCVQWLSSAHATACTPTLKDCA